MPRRSTGSRRNGASLLKIFGRDVTLQDGSVIQGILKTEPSDDAVNRDRYGRSYSYHLWVPVLLKGTLGVNQEITTGGSIYLVADAQDDDDGWMESVLSRKGAATTRNRWTYGKWRIAESRGESNRDR